jgi:hypothetical protein
MAFSFSPKIVSNGLVLYLDAANPRSYPGTGITWSDLLLSGNNGILTGGPTFNNANGGSIVFNGTNYIDSITQLIPIQDNTPFTVDIIFRTTSTGTAHLIGNWNINVSPGWRIDLNSGQIRFLILNSGGNSGRVATTTATYNNDSIFHLCVIYPGAQTSNDISFYINGGIVPKVSPPPLNTSPGTLINNKITLGASQSNTNNVVNHLSGNIYQTKIYNRALSVVEVLQNYNATKTRFGL